MPAGGDIGRAEGDLRRCPVVGIGAPKGDTEALVEVLAAMPADGGRAFVVVWPPDARGDDQLAALGGRIALPVVEAIDGARVEPNRVYVVARSDVDPRIEGGVLRLVSSSKTGGRRRPIDAFFAAMAEDRREYAVGVLLPGAGAAGRAGLKAIRANDGLAIALAPAMAAAAP